jgi:peptidoglycan/xylan/chitin deacetylase (PgdA/CDA1 family)
MMRLGLLRGMLRAGLASAFTRTGLLRAVRGIRQSLRGPRIHVIGYHRVVENVPQNGPLNPSLCISVEAFRQQMELVRDEFVVLSLDFAVRAMAGEIELASDACTITFDDGYRDVILRANPVLQRLGLPATVFVPSGYAGSPRLLPHDRLFALLFHARRIGIELSRLEVPPQIMEVLSRAAIGLYKDGPGLTIDYLVTHLHGDDLEMVDRALVKEVGEPILLDEGARVLSPIELRQLAEAGWEIGAHTVGHRVLVGEEPVRVREELSRPRAEIERWTGRPCRFFAYCNGLYSPALMDAVREVGYEGAVTTHDRANYVGSDRFRIGRKVLWEGHARGLDGRFSSAISSAHLHDLFGLLRLTSPIDGLQPQEALP